MAEAKEIELTTDAGGRVRRIVVDGVDISGWINGTQITVQSNLADEQASIVLAITAPVIRYKPIEETR